MKLTYPSSSTPRVKYCPWTAKHCFRHGSCKVSQGFPWKWDDMIPERCTRDLSGYFAKRYAKDILYWKARAEGKTHTSISRPHGPGALE